MRRPLVLLTAALLALATPTPAASAADEHVVNFYNWTDYIDPAVLERFTRDTGIKVQYDVYDSLETLEGKLLAGHSGYDIVVPTSEPTFSRLIAAKALAPLDRAKLPNAAGLDPKLMARVRTSDPGNKYGGIYLWGTIGLGTVPDKIKALAPDAPMDSWKLLLDPANAKRIAPCGIAVMDSAIDTIPSVLRYLGHDPSSTNARDLAEVEKTLMAIRPFIRTFTTAGTVEALAGGQTCLAMSYSGDVIQAAARAKEAGGATVEYVAPQEFAQLWFDMLAMPADAPHKDDALKLVNFLWAPANAAAISNRVQYANAIPASLPDVDRAIRDNTSVYPSEAQMARFFTVVAPPQSADRARTRMWARFKAGS